MVAFVGEAVNVDGADNGERAIGIVAHEAVGRHEAAVIAWRTAASRDHRHECHNHQYDQRQLFHLNRKDNKKRASILKQQKYLILLMADALQHTTTNSQENKKHN